MLKQTLGKIEIKPSTTHGLVRILIWNEGDAVGGSVVLNQEQLKTLIQKCQAMLNPQAPWNPIKTQQTTGLLGVAKTINQNASETIFLIEIDGTYAENIKSTNYPKTARVIMAEIIFVSIISKLKSFCKNYAKIAENVHEWHKKFQSKVRKLTLLGGLVVVIIPKQDNLSKKEIEELENLNLEVIQTTNKMDKILAEECV